MATAKPLSPQPAYRRQPSRWRLWLAFVVAAPFVAALVWFWRPLNAYADTGAAYGARIACSCRYVAGRDLKSCRADFEPGMALVTLSEDEETKTVTAGFPLLPRQSATFREGEGCVLQRWED